MRDLFCIAYGVLSLLLLYPVIVSILRERRYLLATKKGRIATGKVEYVMTGKDIGLMNTGKAYYYALVIYEGEDKIFYRTKLNVSSDEAYHMGNGSLVNLLVYDKYAYRNKKFIINPENQD